MGCNIPADLLNMGDDPKVSDQESIVRGEVLDVSLTGLRLKVSYNVPVGSVLSVIVYYQGYESVCLCNVVWKREMINETVYGLYIKAWSKLDSNLRKKLESMQVSSPTPSPTQKSSV